MATPILMPRLTIDMEKGTVLEWHKEEGETVEKGDIVAVVFGDKVEWEVEAPESGVLIKVLIGPDEEVGVAKPIAYVGEEGEEPPADDAPEAPAGAAAEIAPPAEETLPKAEPASPAAGKPKASPAAKRIAREKGIDLTTVTGTGPGGRIVEADVAAYAGGSGDRAGRPSSGPKTARPLTLTPLRRTIAQRMLKSWNQVPHFTVATDVDMEQALAFRRGSKGPDGKPFTVNDLIFAAVGKALAAGEEVQRRWDGETLCALGGSNLGVAVHTEHGLMVPVVEDAGEKTLTELHNEVRAKAQRARSGKLKPEDMQPAVMTVTNLGMFGITRFHAVINHPECSILAVGMTEERPVARDGWIGAKPIMALDFAVDHRAIDGGTASQFLAKVKEILEKADFV
ncbi:MAG: dihydrolipoamide acetyltransferase family protein [Planctomycetota bacterium]|jgi:pyruvate dehydrogenase E2 component (dihydrolipoamide acetyltransferase)